MPRQAAVARLGARVACGFVLACASWCAAATWQYRVSFERGPDRRGRPRGHGDALLWLPPKCERLRGLLLAGRLGIEGELTMDPVVRAACADNGIGIVYFSPHISGVFHFWKDGNRDGAILLKALDDLAGRSGHPELRRVPWITAGHSTAGVFARNVAYWRPKRVASILHIKSGNFHQKEHVPPAGSLKGIPLVAINGQFETYGPEGGIRPELGRETQWAFVLRDIHGFRRRDPNHLMSLLVHPGADHFHGAPEIAKYVARFIRRTAAYRLPATLPPGDEPVECLPVTSEDGWLTSPDLYAPKHPAAACADYRGDRTKALWHFDREMADATIAMHRNLGNHQALANPSYRWLDEGDGYAFGVQARFLDEMPKRYGGRLGGLKLGHAKTPIVYRCKLDEPVQRLGPDRFRLLRPARRVHVAAFSPGDARYRSTIRWGSVSFRPPKGAAKQTISFPPVRDFKPDTRPVPLEAEASSSLAVHYEVEYGPVAIEGNTLRICDLPVRAQLPIECKVTAYQIGRRTAPAVAPAEPASVTFRVLAP